MIRKFIIIVLSIIKKIISFFLPGEIEENKYLLFDLPILRHQYFINYIKALLMTPYYRLLMKKFRPQSITRKKYYVSVCAIFKDEGCYLKEWLEFHKIIGIEHFYLYNNFSSDNYLEVLEPYIQAGDVTLTDWPVPQGQMSAYQDCFNRFRDNTNWIAFIDLDEFIIPNKTDTIGEFLKPFEKYPVVLLYWRYFGASGLIDRDINGLVTEDFKVCGRKYVNVGKIIFNTAYNLDGSHKKSSCLHHLSWGSYHNTMLPPVNCSGNFVLYDIHRVNSHDLPVQINHYLTKSYKEFFDRKALKGDVFFASFEDDHYSKYFWYHNKTCQGLDVHAYKYIIPLKLSMSGKSVLMHNRGGVKLLRAFAFTKSNEFKLAA